MAEIFKTLGRTGIDFIHTTEYRALAPAFGETGKSLAELAEEHGRVSAIVNGNLDDPADGAGLVDSGIADIVALGKPALANRDWPQRVRAGRPLPDVPRGCARTARDHQGMGNHHPARRSVIAMLDACEEVNFVDSSTPAFADPHPRGRYRLRSGWDAARCHRHSTALTAMGLQL